MPDDSEAEDRPKVGYRNPPATHQFRKGQSGNVLGRPPKSSTKAADCSPLGKAYLAEAQRKLRITEAGKVSQLKTDRDCRAPPGYGRGRRRPQSPEGICYRRAACRARRAFTKR